MVLTASNMMPLGTQAPDFTLPDMLSGATFSLKNRLASTATVIMFICNHCPYVKHLRFKIAEVARTYQAKGITFIAINSNDTTTYPEDAPDKMKLFAQESGFTFPYLFDETQEIAKSYQAACTPDFYIFDKDLKCAYRGRFDDSTPQNNHPMTGAELTAALDCLLNNQPVNSQQNPSIGCNIKWKNNANN